MIHEALFEIPLQLKKNIINRKDFKLSFRSKTILFILMLVYF